MVGKKSKISVWIPRILAIGYLLFLAMFSLDVLEEGKGWTEMAVGLLIHNIPVLILALVLAIGWKRKRIAGVGFVAAAFYYVIMVRGEIGVSLVIAGPALVVGLMFLLAK